MMFVLVFVSVLALGSAQWYSGSCGVSKYGDAGLGCPIGGGACGTSQARIDGGIEARPGEFPWMVSLRRTSDDRHICGGTIISDRWILTTAYCTTIGFDDVVGDITVVVGAHDFGLRNETNYAEYPVVQIITNEDYNYIQGAVEPYDIALLAIDAAAPIVFNDDVQPICAPVRGSSYVGPDRDMTLAGWGATFYEGPVVDVLNYIGLVQFTRTYCDTLVTTPLDYVCASDTGSHEGRGFCNQDVGGVLADRDPTTGVFSAPGLAVQEFRCADGRPGVFMNLAEPVNHDWVTCKVDKAGNPDICG